MVPPAWPVAAVAAAAATSAGSSWRPAATSASEDTFSSGEVVEVELDDGELLPHPAARSELAPMRSAPTRSRGRRRRVAGDGRTAAITAILSEAGPRSHASVPR